MNNTFILSGNFTEAASYKNTCIQSDSLKYVQTLEAYSKDYNKDQ